MAFTTLFAHNFAGAIFVVLVAMNSYVLLPVNAGTTVTVDGERWYINGKVTNANSAAEGLLPNARMIQGVFDDTNISTRNNWAYPDTHVWDPERNTDEFVGNMSSWRDAGLLSFTVGLQGGSPHCYGNFGWHVSAFDARGNLDAQ